jgi:hypothetical protein
LYHPDHDVVREVEEGFQCVHSFPRTQTMVADRTSLVRLTSRDWPCIFNGLAYMIRFFTVFSALIQGEGSDRDRTPYGWAVPWPISA